VQTWSSGSSSPVMSDDSSSCSSNDLTIQKLKKHHEFYQQHMKRRNNSLSTSDEGIVIDYNEEVPRKKKVSFTDSILKVLNLEEGPIKWQKEISLCTSPQFQ
jgi:hypothetical protein